MTGTRWTRLLPTDWRDAVWLAPWLGVLLVVQVVAVIRSKLGLRADELSDVSQLSWIDPGSSLAIVGDDLSTRLVWGLAATAFVLSWIVTLIVSLYVVVQSLERYPRTRRFALLLTFALLAWGFTLKGSRLALTLNTMKQVSESLSAHFSAWSGSGFWMPRIVDVETAFGRLAITAAVLLTMASSMALVPVRASREGLVEQLARQSRQLQAVLYVGAAVLVAGVLQIGVLHSWPATFLPPEQAASVKTIANGISVAIGGYWSLVLIGLYAPAALFLAYQSRRSAASQLPEAPTKELDLWLEERGLVASPAQQLMRLVAVLGPLLAGGPATRLMESLLG